MNGLSTLLSPQQEVENIPTGFSAVSLIEALNGPPHITIRNPNRTDAGAGGDNVAAATDDADAAQAAEILNRASIDGTSTKHTGKNIVNPSAEVYIFDCPFFAM